ncbi:MAG: DUF58 domain-containing protein [Acidobacteriota bacterium]
MSRSAVRSDGMRVTRVGVWTLIFSVLLLVAATNTGNNGLYLAVATIGAVLVVSHIIGGRNVRGLQVAIEAPDEIYANRPCQLDLEVENRGWLPRWLLLLSVERVDIEPPSKSSRRRAASFLVPYLQARGGRVRQTGYLELLMRRRGRWRIRRIHVSSLFPLGLFYKGCRYPVDLEMLVYPEIYPASELRPANATLAGDDTSRQIGRGHDLLSLRPFRPGDDPRAIHWKQTARIGELIVKEREADEGRRLSIVFDNAVGELEHPADRARFEKLISEAATAAVDHLTRGFQVALTTRDDRLPFAGGRRQRLAILETLALLEPRARTDRPLTPRDPREPHLRLALAAGQPSITVDKTRSTIGGLL